MTNDTQGEREAFEAWYRDFRGKPDLTLPRWRSTGAYESDNVEFHWRGWLGARSILAADALSHLGEVLSLLSDLHPDHRCPALDEALAFYNEHCPDAQVEPVGDQTWHLVSSGDDALFDAAALLRAAGWRVEEPKIKSIVAKMYFGEHNE